MEPQGGSFRVSTLQRCVLLEFNSINRFENYGPGICIPRYPHEEEVYNLLSKNYRISAASKANRSNLKEVETSYVRPDRGYFIPTIGDFELAWQPGDLISSPFTNPNLRASSDPGRILKKEGDPEPLVDWFDIDWGWY